MLPFSVPSDTKYWLYGMSAGLVLLVEAAVFWTPVSMGALSAMLALVYMIMQLRPIRVPISRFSALPLSVLDISLVMIGGYGFSLLMCSTLFLQSKIVVCCIPCVTGSPTICVHIPYPCWMKLIMPISIQPR